MKEYRIDKPNKTLRTEEMEFFKMRTINFRAMAAHMHFHDAIEVIYMNRGSVTVSIDGVKTSIYPGDVALFRSRAIHDIWTEEEVDNDYYVLKLEPRFLYDIAANEKLNNFALRFLICNPALKTIWRKEEIEGTDIELGLKRLIGTLDRTNPIHGIYKVISALMVVEGLYASDNEIMQNISLSDEGMYRALFYINKHFDEPISADEIAERINMSISSFSRAFKSATGQSFKDYLNTVRTNRAEELLITTELPVRDVAVRCGYNNISHFIAVYKKYKGKTPLEERK